MRVALPTPGDTHRPNFLLPLALLLVLTFVVPSTARLASSFQPAPAIPTGVMGASTKVIARDGSVVGSLHGDIDRDPVRLERIPKELRHAVIAIEDRRFWKHSGIDPRGIGRAFTENIRARQMSLQGGSTITQQLVKNLYFANQRRTVPRKAAEAVLAIGIEQVMDKDEILELYLNTVYFGRGVYGVQAAAKSFFRKDVDDLTLAESAFLAGLIHTPARYDWTLGETGDQGERRRAAVQRRNVVLGLMTSLGSVDLDAARAAAAQPLDVEPPPRSEWNHPYFMDAVLRELGVLRNNNEAQLDDRFGFLGATPSERAANVYRGGLRIHTTVDPTAQSNAEDAVRRQLPPGTFDRYSAAVVALDPKTGEVRALVGGRDYYPNGCEDTDAPPSRCRYGKVNLALGDTAGGSGRQAGSAFKSIVLAAALEDGVSMRQTLASSPIIYDLKGTKWKVDNYEGGGGGTMDIVQATAKSVNAAYARLEVDVLGDGDPFEGSRKVAETARKLGIGFPTADELKKRCGDRYGRNPACTPADKTPSIALGAKEISPISLTRAYAAIAAEGMATRPTTIQRITDASGRTLYEADHKQERAISRESALGVSYALRRVVQQGTGRRAQLGRPVAGKTGTSQQWRDAWFVGYVPQLVAGVWMGKPVPDGSSGRITGGSYPAQIWEDFMSATVEDMPVKSFPEAPQELFDRKTKKVKSSGIEEPTCPSGSQRVNAAKPRAGEASAGDSAAPSFTCVATAPVVPLVPRAPGEIPCAGICGNNRRAGRMIR